MSESPTPKSDPPRLKDATIVTVGRDLRTEVGDLRTEVSDLRQHPERKYDKQTNTNENEKVTENLGPNRIEQPYDLMWIDWHDDSHRQNL